MAERMPQSPRQYETRFINGREVRVEVPVSAPVPETFEKVTPLAPVTPEAEPAPRTVAIIQHELDELKETEAIFMERYHEIPENLANDIKKLEDELRFYKVQNDALAHKADIVQSSASQLAELSQKEAALAREFEERKAAIERERLEAEEATRQRLAKIERENELINKVLRKPQATPAAPAKPPRVTRLSEVVEDDAPTMMFDKPLVTEPKVAAEVVEESISHTKKVDTSELDSSEELLDANDEFTFARPASTFTGEVIDPLDGQKFAERGRVRQTFEKISALPRRTRVVGGVALAAVAVAIGAPLTISHFTHNSTPAANEQVDQVDTDNQALANELLGSCSPENSFDTSLLTQNYNAAAGIVWVTQNGAVQSNGTIHQIGPNEARTTSMMKINKGEIDVTMCDDDKAPAITVKGNDIKVNLDNVTMLAKVTNGNKESSTKYAQPDLSNVAPASDGSLTAEDIAEIKENSVNTDLLAAAQKQVLSSISETLKTNHSLTQDTAEQHAKDNTEDFVKKQLAALGKDGDYNVKVTGEAKSFKAITPVTPDNNKKVLIDKVDVTIAE